MKKQRRYPFAKHKLAPDRRMGGFAFYDDPDPLSTILHRNCRVETLIIRYLANVSRRNLNENRNEIIVVYKSDTHDNFITKI